MCRHDRQRFKISGGLMTNSHNLIYVPFTKSPCLCALVLLSIGLCSPAMAKRKPKPFLVPTQPDITEGCISIKYITFHPRTFTRDAYISATVESICSLDTIVTIHVAFFNASNQEIEGQNPPKLLLKQRDSLPLYAPQGSYDHDRGPAVAGRITFVRPEFQP